MWYANAAYTRCPIGADCDEDEQDSTEAWLRQLAPQPIDDAAANDLLDRALAGVDPEALSPQDELASEVARQVMEALTRCEYFWCVDRSDDGRPTGSWGHWGRLTPQRRGRATRGFKIRTRMHAARRSRR